MKTENASNFPLTNGLGRCPRVSGMFSITSHKLRITVVVVMLLLSISANSQTYQPAQAKFIYKGNSIYLDQHSDYQQKKVALGFHWNTGYKLNESLQADEYMDWGGGGNVVGRWEDSVHTAYWYTYRPSYTNPDTVPRKPHRTNLILNSPYIGFAWSELSIYRRNDSLLQNEPWTPWSISHNIAIEYEPTYRVNISNPTEWGNWQPRQYDTTGYAFGFGVVHGYITEEAGNANYNRLQLNQDSLVGQVVLAEPWICNDLNTIIERREVPNLPGVYEIVADTVPNIYNEPLPASWDTIPGRARVDSIMKKKAKMRGEDWKGVNFYLTINLRRLQSNDIDTTNNDVVLEIRMPYITMDSGGVRNIGYIQFDSIPSPNYKDTLNLQRGKVRKLVPRSINPIDSTPVSTPVIYITRKMLPRGNDAERDITISAFFVCDGDVRPSTQHNYGLKKYWGRDPFPYSTQLQTIDSLKIEVTYRGHSDIGINSIKVWTVASYKMWARGIEGKFDFEYWENNKYNTRNLRRNEK